MMNLANFNLVPVQAVQNITNPSMSQYLMQKGRNSGSEHDIFFLCQNALFLRKVKYPT